MPTPTNLMFKTRGWKVDATTLAGWNNHASNPANPPSVIQAEADMWANTRDGRIAWAELSQTDFTGIEITREVLFPQGASIQEPFPVNGWMDADTSYAGGTRGLGAEVFCYDIWSSKKLRYDDFQKLVNEQSYTGFTQLAPGYLNTVDLGADKEPYWDQEQVYYGRSRYWFPSANFRADVSNLTNQNVRKFQFSKMFDSTWGLMEPMAVSILHHARVWIVSYAQDASSSPGEFKVDEGSKAFYTLPMSNQPMLTMREDPGFLARMQMERRARDV